MQVIDKFEKKFLFGLTRVFAILIIFSILISVGIVGMLFVDFSKGINTQVTAFEVTDAIKPPVVENTTSTYSTSSSSLSPTNLNLLPSVKLPFVLQKHFNEPENIKVLNSWLDVLPLDAQQNFIDEMAATVTESDKLKLPFVDAINKYKQLKFKKLDEERAAKAERRLQQTYFAAFVFGAVTLIALFSLILVLLAIERNTRQVEK
jgi:hypothetical protein